MTALLADSAQLTRRSLRTLSRQPYFIAVTLVQPVIWLLLFGSLFRSVTRLPGFPEGSYISFLTPGIVVMTTLFSSGWSGMGYITDVDRGVMDRLLVSPAPRGSLILGPLGYQAFLTAVQSLIILGLGLAVGARFPGGPAVVAALLVAAMLLAAAFASLSNALALLLRKEESVIAAVTFLVLPLTFLSSTFLPASLMPAWMRTVARANPVQWAVEVGRQTLAPAGHVDWALVGSRLGLLAALALLAGWLSTRAFGVYQRSI